MVFVVVVFIFIYLFLSIKKNTYIYQGRREWMKKRKNAGGAIQGTQKMTRLMTLAHNLITITVRGLSITTRVLCIQVHAYYLYEYTGAVYTGKRVLYLKNLKKN